MYYVNSELAIAWEDVTSTFSRALIDALATKGLTFADNTGSTSSTCKMSGDVYYISEAVTEDKAVALCKAVQNN